MPAAKNNLLTFQPLAESLLAISRAGNGGKADMHDFFGAIVQCQQRHRKVTSARCSPLILGIKGVLSFITLSERMQMVAVVSISNPEKFLRVSYFSSCLSA